MYLFIFLSLFLILVLRVKKAKASCDYSIGSCWYVYYCYGGAQAACLAHDVNTPIVSGSDCCVSCQTESDPNAACTSVSSSTPYCSSSGACVATPSSSSERKYVPTGGIIGGVLGGTLTFGLAVIFWPRLCPKRKKN